MFRDIDQEEKIVDESRKALLACKTKCIKLQKQVCTYVSILTLKQANKCMCILSHFQLDHSKKKNDTAKVQSIEVELTTVSPYADKRFFMTCMTV